MKKTTTTYLQYLADQMLAVKDPKDLAAVLRHTPAQLASMAEKGAYSVFSVPKRNGDLRLIEDPAPALKAVQRALNERLQAVYYFERSEAAYGFVLNPADDPDPRHIVTHAERHDGCRWLLNIDLDDFFHQIDETEVQVAMQQPPFQCGDEVAGLIAKLTTFKGRLPMGAPTSPALSNIVFREEDRSLLSRSRDKGWLYTRYADDLTFSSRSAPMSAEDLNQTIAFIEQELAYKVDPVKRHFSDQGGQKSVTRLVLTGAGVTLPDDFYTELDDTLQDLASARRVQQKMGNRHTGWLSDYSMRVEGMLSFAKRVLGEHDPQYKALLNRYIQATTLRQEDFGAYSWLDFPYM